MKKAIVSIMAVLLIGLTSSAEAIIIDWASTFSNSNAINPQEALGKPDGYHAMFGDNSGFVRTATYSGFGLGDSIDYDTSGFAAFIGVNPATLAVADFITMEANGGTNTIFESSTGEFSDGVNVLSVFHDAANPDNTGPIIAFGSMSNQDYADYFGFYNYIVGESEWVYMLFDINGYSDVNTYSNSFSVTLSATDSGGGTDPDPDVMGRINSIPNHPIPEPTTMLLLGPGLFGLAGFQRRKNGRKIGTAVTKSIFCSKL